jgi:hypothetical protein
MKNENPYIGNSGLASSGKQKCDFCRRWLGTPWRKNAGNVSRQLEVKRPVPGRKKFPTRFFLHFPELSAFLPVRA